MSTTNGVQMASDMAWALVLVVNLVPVVLPQWSIRYLYRAPNGYLLNMASGGPTSRAMPLVRHVAALDHHA